MDIIKKKHGNSTHGLKKTRIYNIWARMKQRCTNKKYDAYYRYGGRGITICDKWMIFENFYNDMNETYKDSLTLDRINNDKGYSKENCRWATRKEQCNNTRANKIIKYEKESYTLASLCEKLNVNYVKTWSRMKCGYSVEESVKNDNKAIKPIMQLYINGQVKECFSSIAKAAIENNIEPSTIQKALKGKYKSKGFLWEYIQ